MSHHHQPSVEKYTEETKQLVLSKFYLKDYFDEKNQVWTKCLAYISTGEYYNGSNNKGYNTWRLKLTNFYINYQIHQLVYLLDKGKWNLDKNGRIKLIDHKDRNKLNNLLNNLDFETNYSKNAKNTDNAAEIQSVLPFVHYDKLNNKWLLKISHKLNKFISSHINRYSTEYEAGLRIIYELEERQPDLFADEDYMNDLILQVYDLYLTNQ